MLSSERTLLVCGDGDLSFSSSVSKKLAEEGVHLTATVLETKENHRQGKLVFVLLLLRRHLLENLQPNFFLNQ